MNDNDILKFDKFEYDKNKTKVLKYILYQKRTKQEVINKFKDSINYDMLISIINYLETQGYIDDIDFVRSRFENYTNLTNKSIYEIKIKILSKGVSKQLIDNYIEKNIDELTLYEIQSATKNILKKKDKEKNYIYTYLLKKGYKKDNLDKAFDSLDI